ncbi:MAG: cellulose synthase complex periplasmic endoglucanase BcsZ [Myxococcota bacterium]
MIGLVLATAFATAACGSAPTGGPAPEASCGPRWPLWDAYAKHFIEADGRVVDNLAKHTTSEGQAYALFHALVARDRATFDRVLAWTEKHLSGGDLGARLPAWRWADGKVADKNPASDADLWMAYVLVQAAAAWDAPELATKGGRLLAQIAAHEVKELSGLGPTLVPAPMGFDLGDTWRLNPSYTPIQLLRWAARIDADGPWEGTIASFARLTDEATPGRVWPDWVGWDSKQFVADPTTGPVGSYDAIRAYLWSAMLSEDEPRRGVMLARGTRLLEAARTLGFAPDKLDTQKRDDLADVVKSANAPVGFQAVAAAFARALGDNATAARLEDSVERQKRADGLYGEPAFYYDQNLVLFAQAFRDGRFRFRADGGLELPKPSVESSCRPD